MNREVILVGRPNSGKSTLFNRLATSHQKVANYAGCTVEKKTAELVGEGSAILITDLPGVYSLIANTKDEEVALDHLRSTKGNSQVAVVIDGNNLKEELVLPLMLRKEGHDIVVVVNMMDEVAANQKILNLAGMSELTGIPFFPVSAKTGEGIEVLRKFLRKHAQESYQSAEAGPDLRSRLHEELRDSRQRAASIYQAHAQEPKLIKLQQRTDAIDRWLLHPFFGPPIFLVAMFLLFQSIFTWSSPLSDQIKEGIALLQELAKTHVPYELLASLLADGAIAGVGSVLVFVPQIAILFLLIGLLELSGYLPRVAYMVDQLLRPYGLEGKVFIPLLSSVACAVPGIMATRTIERERTRLVTIMISPLMTCSARLPVYTLLIGTFIPDTHLLGLSLRGLSMFAMYLLGVVMALVVALVLSFLKLSQEKPGIDIIHLPHYRSPDWRSLFRYVWLRVAAFLKKAGTIIFAMSLLLWALLSFPQDKKFAAQVETQIQNLSSALPEAELAKQTQALKNQVTAQDLQYSLGGRIGIMLEPIFKPIGYDWKLTIGILGSLAAREVFVATLGTVFALGNTEEDTAPLSDTLKNTKDAAGKSLYTLATCLSLLVFFAFSLQCISTIGIARRETNGWRIPVIMFVYMFVLAYGGAFVAYRIGLLFI